MKSKFLLGLAALLMLSSVGQSVVVKATVGETLATVSGEHRVVVTTYDVLARLGLNYLWADFPLNINGRRAWDGSTPLHIALRSGRVELINALLDAGANIEAVNNNGDTPLSVAVDRLQVDMVEALLRRGANPNVIVRASDTYRYYRDMLSTRMDIPLAFLLVYEGQGRNARSMRIRELLLQYGSAPRPLDSEHVVPIDEDDMEELDDIDDMKDTDDMDTMDD